MVAGANTTGPYAQVPSASQKRRRGAGHFREHSVGRAGAPRSFPKAGLSNGLRVDLAGRYSNPVEVVGRWSNHLEQGERLDELVGMAPTECAKPRVGTRKQVQRRLRPREVEDLIAGYLGGATVYQLGRQFRIHLTVQQTQPLRRC